MNTESKAQERDDLAMPDYLTRVGQKAWKAIVDMLKAENATFTGGCKAFYSPSEWKARGEKYGSGSVLIVVHDGGEVGRYFSYDQEDYKAIERMSKELDKLDLFAEQCTTWYSSVHLI